MQVPARRGGLKVSPALNGAVRKRSGLPASSPRADADALEGMLCLAAASQHAGTVRPELKGGFEPMRQESVSSDNDYSEEQYVTTQRLGFPRGSNLESEEDKKEKRRLANREAARRMRRRRATHMQAVEEEVERLSNENSLLLHRMSQLVASHQQVDAENQQLRHDLLQLRQQVGACLQVGQLDLANASLVAAAGGNSISPSMLAAQGKLALGPHEVPPSMAQPRLLIEQQMQRGSVPTTSGGQSNEEMTATEEEHLRHASVAPAHAAAAHSFGSSGEAGQAGPSTGGGSGGNGGCAPARTARKRGSWRPLSPS